MFMFVCMYVSKREREDGLSWIGVGAGKGGVGLEKEAWVECIRECGLTKAKRKTVSASAFRRLPSAAQ